MLYSVDKQEYVDYIPHINCFKTWTGRMTAEEIQAIEDELNRRVSQSEIHVSSWMPGSDWSNTPFDPIYRKACLCNEETSGMCFGLMLWKTLLEREDVWAFGHYSHRGHEIAGMTYFLLANPPPVRVSA